MRHAGLEKLFAAVPPPLHLTRTTRDADVARRWLDEFEGAGLDGVVAKPLDQPYQPGKRAMFTIKHKRTADVVLLGYRIHSPGAGVGSLLVEIGSDGTALTGEKERSRFSSGKDVSFVRLRPERVLEVRYDQMEAGRFRHTVQFERWRPDRDPASCSYDQLEVPIAYDLDDVLQ